MWNAVQQVSDDLSSYFLVRHTPTLLVFYTACNTKSNIALLNVALLVENWSKHLLHSSNYQPKDLGREDIVNVSTQEKIFSTQRKKNLKSFQPN